MPGTRTLSDLHILILGRNALPDVEHHLLALDLPDRAARFGGSVCEEVVSRYVRGIDPIRATLVGAVQSTGGCIIGLAEAQPTDRPRVVELAVSVLAQYRCRGLGQRLLAQAIATAFARGAHTAECLFDPTNRAVAGIVRRLGGRFGSSFPKAEIRCHGPSPWSMPLDCD
jgi:ribosomal protein S18 acetylase RimI-like enzyme